MMTRQKLYICVMIKKKEKKRKRKKEISKFLRQDHLTIKNDVTNSSAYIPQYDKRKT